MTNSERLDAACENSREYGIAVVRCGKTATICLSGWIVYEDSAKVLEETVALTMRPKVRAIAINLSRIGRMDAYALGILASSYKVARSSRVVLTVQDPPPRILEMLRVTGLAKFLMPSDGATKNAL